RLSGCIHGCRSVRRTCRGDYVSFAGRPHRQTEVSGAVDARPGLDEESCDTGRRGSAAQSSRPKREIARMGEKLVAIEVHFEKRIINHNVVREPDEKSRRDYIVATVVGAVFLLGLFIYGWQHYQWIQYGYRIEEAQKKKEQLVEAGRQ